MLTELSCREFAHELASKKPVPGGGASRNSGHIIQEHNQRCGSRGAVFKSCT